MFHGSRNQKIFKNQFCTERVGVRHSPWIHASIIPLVRWEALFIVEFESVVEYGPEPVCTLPCTLKFYVSILANARHCIYLRFVFFFCW